MWCEENGKEVNSKCGKIASSLIVRHTIHGGIGVIQHMPATAKIALWMWGNLIFPLLHLHFYPKSLLANSSLSWCGCPARLVSYCTWEWQIQCIFLVCAYNMAESKALSQARNILFDWWAIATNNSKHRDNSQIEITLIEWSLQHLKINEIVTIPTPKIDAMGLNLV